MSRKSITSVSELDKQVNQFFAKQKKYTKTHILKNGERVLEEFDKPFLMIDLAIHLGICRDTLHRYTRGDFDGDVSEKDAKKYGTYSDILTYAKGRCESSLVEAGMNPSWGNNSIINLNLRANYGYTPTEKVESENINKNLNVEVSPEEIAKKSTSELLGEIMEGFRND